MHKEKRKSATLCLVAAVFLSVFFAQATDALRLTKTAKREGRREAGDATAATVQEGRILFGADFEKRSNLQSLVGNAPADQGDVNSYQADFAGWEKGHAQDVISKEATWKRMSPSLQCAGDQMRFRVIGPGASQLALAQGNSLPLPLTSIPSNCGYILQKNSIGLVILVPYDGCNVIQQGGTFALPLRWQGIPVLLLCPRPVVPTLPGVPPSPVLPAQRRQIPSVLQAPQIPIPQVPLPSPVFHTRRFLAQQAVDPRFPSSPFIPSSLPFSKFPSIALADPRLPILAHNYNGYPHTPDYIAPPPIGAATLNTFTPLSPPFAPLPQAHSPPGPQPGIGQSQLVTDPGVKHWPYYSPHTHFLPMFPRGFSQTQQLPDLSDSKPGILPSPRMFHSQIDSKPGILPFPGLVPPPSDPKPEMLPFPGLVPPPSDPKPGILPFPEVLPFPGLVPPPSDPKPGILPFPGLVPPPSDPWLGMMPPPANGNVDSNSPQTQSHYALHSHSFPPFLRKRLHKHFAHNVPHSHSRNQFDVFPPPNTKS